jgi:FkbM family methyltransferase
MSTHNQSLKNWLNSLTWQIQFASRSGQRRRVDGKSSDWTWFEQTTSYQRKALMRPLKSALTKLGLRPSSAMSVDWLQTYSENLWSTRMLLADDLSRLSFDFSLILRATSHRHFYFPRVDFDDFASLKKSKHFDMEGLPRDYLGLPLQICELTLHTADAGDIDLQVVCNDQLLDGINNYRQYLVTRDGTNMSPRTGDVVLDCGACIGDYSALFAALVGVKGQVHAFDPVPLHNRYCNLQASLNPSLKSVMHFNAKAVGSHTSIASLPAVSPDRIDPGLRTNDESFDYISLDDYAKSHLDRVVYIKMDIEGAEMDALAGAENVIRTYKPRLAISGYHKPSDLWEIPQKIVSLNPGYKLTFGHHSAVQWESVFYAIDQR